MTSTEEATVSTKEATASTEDVTEDGGKTKKKYFHHPIIGRTWFTLMYFIAVGATFAVALGCWSPATEMFSISGTDTSQVISYLSNATGLNETQFQHPDLPDSWSWGFSGTCELYLDSSKDTTCYHAFPPLFSLQDLVAKALSNSNDPDTTATISTWNSALSATPSDPAFAALANSGSQQAHAVSLFRGAAAAIVFSLLIGLSNLLASFALFFASVEERSKGRNRYTLYGIAIFDALVFAAGPVCFTYAMMAGPNAFASDELRAVMTSSVAIGFVVVLAALLCRVISIPVIGLVVLCLLGFQCIIFVLVAYLVWKCMFKTVKILDESQPVGLSYGGGSSWQGDAIVC